MGSQTSTSRYGHFHDPYYANIQRAIGSDLSQGEGIDSNFHLTEKSQVSMDDQKQHLDEQGIDECNQKSNERDENSEDELIPCVFSWNQGGHNIFITGSFNNWSLENKIRLVRSGNEFSTIQSLPRGLHLYKFIVDDQWRYAPDQLTHTDENGNINNVLDITHIKRYQLDILDEIDEAKNATYNQKIPEQSEFTTDAPTIPILLSKYSAFAPDKISQSSIPLHCISNHILHDSYASSLFGAKISCISATQRCHNIDLDSSYGQKYCTCTFVTLNPLYQNYNTATQEEFELHNSLQNIFAVQSTSVEKIEQ